MLDCRQQEAYEKELEKFSIRRQPLGMDRYYRRYWWGLAGLRAQIYVENAENGWAVLTEPSEIETLMDALDKRGNRELALYNSLEKVWLSSGHSTFAKLTVLDQESRMMCSTKTRAFHDTQGFDFTLLAFPLYDQ